MMSRLYRAFGKRPGRDINHWSVLSQTLSYSTDSSGDLEQNPFFSKYADKIAALQKTSPEEFKARLDKAAEKKVMPSAGTEQLANPDISAGKLSLKNHCKPTYTATKTLDKVMKLEMLKDKSAEEIKEIWQQYHLQKKGIWAVLPGKTYDKIYSKSLEYPLFLYPIPRKTGYEFVVAEFSGHACHFTLLLNYQTYKENAPVCLSIFHYPELKEDKGIVLMNGEFDEDHIDASEAQCLVNQLQLYYTGSDSRKEKLLWTFNKDSESFKHMDLVSELESTLAGLK